MNFLDGCCILAALTPALNKWKLIYFLSWKSYFCSFSFHSVLLIPLFVYLKERPSCSFSTITRWGWSGQWTMSGGLWARLGHWPWGLDTHEILLRLLCEWWGLLHAVMLPISYVQTTLASTGISILEGFGGLFPHAPSLRAFSLKVCKHQWIVSLHNRIW